MRFGTDRTMGWSKPKTAIMSRKLLLDAELACMYLQGENVEHSIG
jgi:hypothetical protein